MKKLRIKKRKINFLWNETAGKPDTKRDGVATRKDIDEATTQEKVELIHCLKRFSSDGSQAEKEEAQFSEAETHTHLQKH